MWKPSGFIPPHLWVGTLIMGLAVVSAAVQTIVLRMLKSGAKTAWLMGGIVALVLGVAAIGLQIWELLSLPFFPGASGFASVFVSFYPVYVVVALGAMIWLETLIAGSGRLRRLVRRATSGDRRHGQFAALPGIAERLHRRLGLPGRDRDPRLDPIPSGLGERSCGGSGNRHQHPVR